MSQSLPDFRNYVQKTHPIHRVIFHAHHFLASKEGKKLAEKIKSVNPQLAESMKQHADKHQQILQQIGANPEF